MWYRWTRRAALESAQEIEPLPADLELLAEQLTAEATRLAARYPAGECRLTAADVASAKPSRGRAAWHWAAAAALLIAAGAGGWATWWAVDSPSDAPPPDRVADAFAADDRPTSVLGASAVEGPEAPPAIPFGELSPTEQEAVLDVIEDEGHAQDRLSI